MSPASTPVSTGIVIGLLLAIAAAVGGWSAFFLTRWGPFPRPT